MKRLLFALCFVALLSAVTVELTEGMLGSVEYTVKDPDARDSSLTIVILKGDTQYAVYSEPDFDGVYHNSFQVVEPGEYTLRAYNMDTGGAGESTIVLSPAQNNSPLQKAIEETKKETTEQQVLIDIPDEQASVLPYLIIGFFILLLAIVLFANPFKKKKKKR